MHRESNDSFHLHGSYAATSSEFILDRGERGAIMIIVSGTFFYLFWYLEIDNHCWFTKILRHKRWFQFLFLWSYFFLGHGYSNNSTVPVYKISITKFIQNSKACITYCGFRDRWLLVIKKLFNQDFDIVMLNSYFVEYVACYGESVSQMMTDIFHLS